MPIFPFLDYIQQALRTALLLMIAAMVFTACAAVGPDYHKPEPAGPCAWRAPEGAGLGRGEADSRLMARWWASLNDPVLANIVEQALESSLDVKTARARVREARARWGLSTADRLPSLDAGAAYTRSRMGSEGGLATASQDRDLYNTEFDAAWELDIFGGTSRSIEAAEADLDAAYEALRDARVTLAAETARNYVAARTHQARLKTALNNLNLQDQTAQLTRRRYQAGLTDALDVARARYNLETTRAQIPLLQQSLTEAVNRLAILTGQAPGALDAELEKPRPIPLPPVEVAVGVPADALRRRPDVRKSERLLAAQTARIGVATADLYPKFTLTGVIGLESAAANDLFTAGARFWRYGPGVSWRVFDGGAIRQNIEIQSALQEQALIAYEATVLAALEEAENALNAFVREERRLISLRLAAADAAQAATLSETKYRSGLLDFSAVLDAQRSLVSLEDQVCQSEGAVATHLIQIYKALGGGWEANGE